MKTSCSGWNFSDVQNRNGQKNHSHFRPPKEVHPLQLVFIKYLIISRNNASKLESKKYTHADLSIIQYQHKPNKYVYLDLILFSTFIV